MPGPTYIRGQLVKHALGCGLLLPSDLDQRVAKVLSLIKSLLPLGIPENAPEGTVDTPETAALLRQIGGESLVLLKNEGGVLPFDTGRSIAVIGPNGASATYCGGGSAAILPYYAVTPLEGIRNQVPSAEYQLGCPAWKKLPLLSNVVKRSDGKAGFDVQAYLQPPAEKNRKAIDSFKISTSDVFLADYKNEKIESNLFFLDLDAIMVPEETTEYEFSLSVSGTGKLFVDGDCIIDNMTPGMQIPGDSFFGSGTIEAMATITLQKGRRYNIHISFGTLPTRTFTVAGATAFGAGGLRAGCFRKIDRQLEIEKAVALAKRVDQVVLCVGLNNDWESEGYDRSTMDLPLGSDDLIRAVTASNPNTAVIVQSGKYFAILTEVVISGGRSVLTIGPRDSCIYAVVEQRLGSRTGMVWRQ
jgi:beta-glucosidase